MAAGGVIALAGASGTLGSRIARELERRQIRARLLARAPDRLEAGFHDPILADLDRPETLPPALAGVDTLILITAESPDQDRQGIAAIEAARAGGASRIVLLSAMLAVATPERHFGGQHGRIEQALAASGIGHVILRPSFFMQSFLLFLDDLRRGRLIVPVRTGHVCFVDARDVAEAALRAALGEVEGPGPYVLTGEEAFSFAEAAALLSRASPRPIRHIAPPRWVARIMLSMSQGRYVAANLDYLFRNLEAGREAEPRPDLTAILGRAPGTFCSFIEREMRPALNP